MARELMVLEHWAAIRERMAAARQQGLRGLNYKEMPADGSAIREICRRLQAEGCIVAVRPLERRNDRRWLRIVFQ